MAVPGPRLCARVPPAAESGGHTPPWCVGPPPPRPHPPRTTGSRRAGPATVAHGPRPLRGTRDPPRPGPEPAPPAPAGRPPTTAPPGKPAPLGFCSNLVYIINASL